MGSLVQAAGPDMQGTMSWGQGTLMGPFKSMALKRTFYSFFLHRNLSWLLDVALNLGFLVEGGGV